MDDPTPKETEGDDPATEGVFGNLPRSRPAVRSPRRDAASSPAPRRTQRKAESRASGPRPRTAQDPMPPEAPPGGEGGIEDVMWAGVTVAAEAATLGLRLFGRAVEAVRRR